MDNSITKIYSAAIYLRLSREDGDVADGSKEVSNSIANQKELVMDYLKSKNDITLHSVYTDDGYSGVSFDRPGFQKMINDIRAGLVDCVIVKDLSRFGRNYIEAGRYIEKIFPMLGVRFIAITDNYDSLTSEDGYGSNMIIPFKNLVNDAYARDISIKVRTNLQSKRKKGQYIGAFVVYGYTKDPDDKNKLVIDEYAAEVVKDIFAMKMCGLSQQMIADKLNADGILSPYEYKKSLGIQINDNFKKSTKALWSYNAVLRILKNEIYTGKLIQGRTTTPNYKIKKKVVKDTAECICVENTHEAIINKTQFDLVQGLLIRDTRVATTSNEVCLLGGMLFCAGCGKPMVRKNVPSGGKKYFYYVCSVNKKDKNRCSNHRISEANLLDSVEETCLAHLNKLLDYKEKLEYVEKTPYMKADVSKIEGRIGKKQEELDKLNQRKLNLYNDLKDGILSREEYEMFKSDYDKQIAEAEGIIASLNTDKQMILDNSGASQVWLEQFRQFKGISKISRNVAAVMIDRVLVHSAERIEIRFKFEDKFKSVEQYVDGYYQEYAEREAM